MSEPYAIPTNDERLADRFWAKVNKDGPIQPHCPELGPCWVWTGRLHEWGYGLFDLKKYTSPARAHRVSWTLTSGLIPEGQFALHRCDNPPCVNPTHLFLGTHDDNMRDMVAKQRAVRGERHCSVTHAERTPRGECHFNAKLTRADVLEIRAASIVPGFDPLAEASKRHVSYGAIYDAVARRTWKHV